MLTVSLFGAGRIGNIHALNVSNNPKAKLKYIVDVNAEAAQKLALVTGAKVSDVHTAITDPDVDAVIIASSTDTHAELLIQAAQNNKAILCEKPIDLDIRKVRDCIAAIEKYSVPCALGFNRRFDPSFSKLKSSLKNGEIGNLEKLSIISRDPFPPSIDYVKVSGGLFRDMMIHDLDMARWILEEEPIEIYAVASNLVNPEIGEAGDIDTAMVILKTQSGKLSCISNSRHSVYGYDQRIEAFGSNGSIQVNNPTETTVIKSCNQGVISEKAMDFFLERYEKSYQEELNHFIDCISSGKELLVTHYDGARALELADAAYESWKKGIPVSC
jgi:myo-inositol 2-dehydrogenase / D-chiro-inositol 1-dehydrogenase